MSAGPTAPELPDATKGVNLSGKTWAGIGSGLGGILIAAATWANSMQQTQATTAAELAAMKGLMQDMKADFRDFKQDIAKRIDRLEGNK